MERHNSHHHTISDSFDLNANIVSPIGQLLCNIRLVMRNYLYAQVEYTTFNILPILHSLRGNKYIDSFFEYASLCGEEEFYMLLIPIVLWNSQTGENWTFGFISLFILSLMIGNFFKNFMALPRPPLRFLINNSDYDEGAIDNRDFGWPSTHAANAVVIPFYLIQEFSEGVWIWNSSDPLTLIFFNTLAVLWCLSITTSRMYLGVHSPTDIQGGMILGGILLKLWSWFGHSFLFSYLHYEYTMHVSTFLVITFLLIHPRPIPPMANYTYQEVVTLGGFLNGFLCGYWYRWGSFRPIIELYSYVTIYRNIVGFIFFASSFLIVRKFSNIVFPILFSPFNGPQVTTKAISTRLIVVKKDIDYNIGKLAARFVSYAYLGIMCTNLAPMIFDYLSLWQ